MNCTATDACMSMNVEWFDLEPLHLFGLVI